MLEILDLSRSTYYYQVKQLAQEDKDMDLRSSFKASMMNIMAIMAIVAFIWN
ncbi:hypothetical protein [Streptococcus equi]|uniref:hypothetical protein n=1 Tax=Streptococcus equi TaxID=1336 RepID=UPI0039C61749